MTKMTEMTEDDVTDLIKSNLSVAVKIDHKPYSDYGEGKYLHIELYWKGKIIDSDTIPLEAFKG